MRFKGFTEKWEVKKLGEVATNKSRKYNPVNSNGTINCIELEHLSSETGQLLGYIDGSYSGSIKNVFNKGDVLFGKLRPYLRKYLQAPFDGVCSSEIWVLRGKEISNDFLFYIIQTDRFFNLTNQSSGSKMPRADWNIVEQGVFSFPNIFEQQKVASFLTLIDERIATQSKIIENLETLMQSLREKLFTQKLRFKDEKGQQFPDWEVKKLGEITYKVDKKNKNRENLPIYSISNINGFVPQSEQFEGIDSNERGYDISLYKIIEKETFVYNPARINVGSIGYSGNIDKVIVSSLYVCFKTINSINNDFFKHFVQTTNFKSAVLRNGEGGVRIYLFYENFSEIKIWLPSLEEQVRIAHFLSILDSKIDIEKSLLQQMQNQKKYLLQNLFI